MKKTAMHGENESCRYCKYASPLAKRDEYYCEKRGPVEPCGYCRKFSFDPLSERISPIRLMDTSEFDPRDFKID